jgi:hypothetical protein
MPKRGRPAYQPTKVQRNQVAIAAGAGIAHEEIALGLGITRKTLLKYFAEELTTGAYRKRLEVMQAMHRAAKKGNVAAAKAYMSMTPDAAAPPVPKEPEQPAEPKVPALGKKEQAQIDAGSAHVGTEWADLLDQRPNTLPQ